MADTNSTQEPTQAAPTAVPTTPVPPVPAPSPPPATTLDPDVYADDGKKWRDKAVGARGWVKQIQDQATQEKGGLEARIAALTGQIGERDTSITRLTEQMGTLTETANTIPTLQTQIEELQQQTAVAEKYRVALEFPALLALQTEEVVKGENGDEQTVTRSPILTLIESTTLDQTGLREQLKQLEAALPKSAPASVASPIISGATPSPAAPAEGEGSEHWYSEAMKYKDRMNAGEPNLFELSNKAWHEYGAALVREGAAS